MLPSFAHDTFEEILGRLQSRAVVLSCCGHSLNEPLSDGQLSNGQHGVFKRFCQMVQDGM